MSLVCAIFCAMYPTSHASGADEGTHAARPYAGRLNSNSAVVHYGLEDEAFARLTAEILDYARNAIGTRYGKLPGKVRVHVYATNELMVEGVRSALSYDDLAAAAVVRVGATQVEKGTLHLHRRLANSQERLWHVLIDEYVQGVTEAKYGAAPALLATWMDEGLSSYLAYDVLKEIYPRYAEHYRESVRKAAFKALALGRLPLLEDVSDRERWFRAITESVDAWRNEYAKADISVAYIVDTYGIDSLTAVLRGVMEGLPYPEAIYRELGVTAKELEASIHASLFFSGLLVLFRAHAAVFLLGLPVVAVLLWLGRWKRSKYQQS